MNTRENRAIIKKRVDGNDSISLNRIARSIGIARYTVQSIVKNELGLRSYPLLNVHQLTEAAKENREEKCKELLRLFSVRRVEDVLCTDEKIFTIEVPHKAQNDRQLLRPDQGHARKRKIVTKSLFPKGLMVWASITANQKTPLVFVERNVKTNAGTYQEEVLKKVVLPFYEKNPEMIFQQDWASVHGARTTIAYLVERSVTIVSGRRISDHLSARISIPSTLSYGDT